MSIGVARWVFAFALVPVFVVACSGGSDDGGVTQEKNATEGALKSCRSINDAEGRCLSSKIGKVAEQIDSLPSAGCASGELCAPCFDPRDGADTGACRVAPNDAPKEPKKEFASCCGGRAKCVPKSRVGEDRLENLDACDGSSGDVCVPLAFVSDRDFKGAKCKGQVNISETSKLPYDGVCLSDCLNIPSKDLLSRDGCQSGDLCVPCTHPVTGVPTGAPGCE